ncbi:sensor histidine kinase [Kaistia dalseonensis]|uniref:histidine kinase n=1 Tax=Kaistia dalseonensis TaxID=410840 RepID=A0ABU0H7L9_9HYPH|nr:sensor histidine kinase [Kaistia dalseonensis]MCX5494923.1 sensor histidine kinase [Kaistia dalseonensis]MDQ0437504.1 two-component system sensor histidine kinase ChvG [Kaistia dalseonensis]
MTISIEEQQPTRSWARRTRLRHLRRLASRGLRSIGIHAFSSLTRRIIILNLAALIVLVSGILYLNQFRAGLIDARLESLLTQGEIIAGAIAASATVETNNLSIDPDKLLELQAGESLNPADSAMEGLDFPINPERVAPVLRRLISPTRTRARIYDRDGSLVLDSRHLYSRGQILRFDLPSPTDDEPALFDRVWEWIKVRLQRDDLPIYHELAGANGKGYPEVATALDGGPSSIVRITERGELIVSVAVPIQRYRSVLGVLLLSTQGGDIDAIVHNERMAIVRVFLVSAAVVVVLSILLASTIAAPLRRLADAADRVKRGVTSRPQIPDFTSRRDEIGHLSLALREMTAALFNRIEAIESFAADVSHELKNPLTSLRSAVETLPLAKSAASKARLTEIIQHDVQRLNRLISDISDASRLDAELARQDAVPVNVAGIIEAVVTIARETAPADGPNIVLDIAKTDEDDAYVVLGHDSRLGQVFTNLLDNARSFCRPGGTVRVMLRRSAASVEVVIDDDGPGIRAEQVERIFERFYTDRPEQEAFGQNSGLGLSISKQIVEAHRGRIWAENRMKTKASKDDGAVILGARFTVRLPGASNA